MKRATLRHGFLPRAKRTLCGLPRKRSTYLAYWRDRVECFRCRKTRAFHRLP